MREGAVVLVGAGVAVARLVEDAAELLEVIGEHPGVGADPPALVVRLPEGAVEVPDGLVHLCSMTIRYLMRKEGTRVRQNGRLHEN